MHDWLLRLQAGLSMLARASAAVDCMGLQVFGDARNRVHDFRGWPTAHRCRRLCSCVVACASWCVFPPVHTVSTTRFGIQPAQTCCNALGAQLVLICPSPSAPPPPPPPCRRHAGQRPCVSRGAAGLRVRQHLPAHGCRLPRHLVEGLGGGRARCGERCLMRHRAGMPCHLCGPTQLFARLCCPVPGVYLSANHTRHCCGVPVCQLCCVCGSSALW